MTMQPTRPLTRREFVIQASAAATLLGAASPARALGAAAATSPRGGVPSYLAGYETRYAQDPRAAATEWFRAARYGLFLHYGLYSLLKRHEWVQLREKIPVAEYAKLKAQFTAAKFDAGYIADLAVAAGMRYINLTTRHHDSFCLFETKQTDFHSMNSPAKRDLVGELAAACRQRGLGFCLYYSHGRDWRHPHAPNNGDWRGNARPAYDPPEPTYATGAQHDLKRYLDFMSAQITELLANYGPIAAIWLDGIAVPLSGDRQKFKCQELYDLIHRLQPQVLVSYKQGLIGTEDFFAPEHKAVPAAGGKPMEICTTLQKGSWGYHETFPRLGPDDVMARLAEAAQGPANLLLNTGPAPDGSIHSQDEATLSEVGRRLKTGGFPSASAAPAPAKRD